MRKFWLEKETGERLSLQSDTLLFCVPQGLGFAEERSYKPVENGFFEIADERMSQSAVSGTLVFRKNPYETYREVSHWIAGANELKLVYCPYGSVEYYMDIRADALDKGEVSAGTLQAPIQMNGLTPWYSRNRLVFACTEKPSENYKRYAYQYPYQYGVSGVPGKAEFRISGHFDGGISLYAPGPLVSPVFTLTDMESGRVCGKLDLSTISIAPDEQLIYSSRARGAGVWRQKDGKRTDLIDSVELHAGVPVFMRVPVGVPVVATLTMENMIEAASTLYVDEYWKTR